MQARVLESQHKSVQCLAGKLCGHCKRVALCVRFATWRGPAAAILRVANQGMAQMGEMDPDLVSAPGFQAAFDQRGERAFHRAKAQSPFRSATARGPYSSYIRSKTSVSDFVRNR